MPKPRPILAAIPAENRRRGAVWRPAGFLRESWDLCDQPAIDLRLACDRPVIGLRSTYSYSFSMLLETEKKLQIATNCQFLWSHPQSLWIEYAIETAIQ